MEVITLNGKQQELYRYVQEAEPEGLINQEFVEMVNHLELSYDECELINSLNIFEFDRFPNCVRVRTRARIILN